MTEQEIYEKLQRLFRKVAVRISSFSNTQFEDDLQADSVDLMEFILTVEDEFGIEISDEYR